MSEPLSKLIWDLHPNKSPCSASQTPIYVKPSGKITQLQSIMLPFSIIVPYIFPLFRLVNPSFSHISHFLSWSLSHHFPTFWVGEPWLNHGLIAQTATPARFVTSPRLLHAVDVDLHVGVRGAADVLRQPGASVQFFFLALVNGIFFTWKCSH